MNDANALGSAASPRVRAIMIAYACSMIGCGARTSLRVDEQGTDAGPKGTASCSLAVGFVPTRIFPESNADSESITASFTRNIGDDRACFLSLHKLEGSGTFTVHQRCMRGWGALDRGPDVVMGSTMTDSFTVPPADILVAPGAPSGFAFYYHGSAGTLFDANVSPGDMTLPTMPVVPVTRPFLMGPSNGLGHLLVYVDVGAQLLATGRLRADGQLTETGTILCPTSSPRDLRTVRVGNTDLVAMNSHTTPPPACTPNKTSTIRVRSTEPNAPLQTIPTLGVVDTFDMTPFDGDHAFIVMAEQSPDGTVVEAALVDASGALERRFIIGSYTGGFGFGTAELGGSLLVIEDAPRSIGTMTASGFTALLVDPTNGAITSRVDLPIDTATVDVPSAPAIVTSDDGMQALLGFFVQPVGTGGRDYVARLDCKPL